MKVLQGLQIFALVDYHFMSASSSETKVLSTYADGSRSHWLRISQVINPLDTRSLRFKPFSTLGAVPADSVLTNLSGQRPLLVNVSGYDAIRFRNDASVVIEIYISHLENV